MSRRSRRRGGRSRLPTVLVALAVVGAVLGGAGLASTAYTTASTPRGASADVTIDESGAHALDAATSLSVNATGPLVTVTNRLTRDASVTVTLRADSTAKGDLVVDGVREGDSATVHVSAGDSRTVDVRIPDDGSLVGETMYFHVNATATGLDVSAPDRSAPIDG